MGLLTCGWWILLRHSILLVLLRLLLLPWHGRSGAPHDGGGQEGERKGERKGGREGGSPCHGDFIICGWELGARWGLALLLLFLLLALPSCTPPAAASPEGLGFYERNVAGRGGRRRGLPQEEAQEQQQQRQLQWRWKPFRFAFA